MQMQTPTEYDRAIAAIMATMPLERKAQLYEYALFIQSRVVELAEEDAWLNASEAEMQAEDALWASIHQRNPKSVQRMADAALESLSTTCPSCVPVVVRKPVASRIEIQAD
jgi:hypothetical protein